MGLEVHGNVELNALLGRGLTLGLKLRVSPARTGVSTHVDAVEGVGPKPGAGVGNRRGLRFSFGWELMLRFRLTLELKLWLEVKEELGFVTELGLWLGWDLKLGLELGWRWS